MQFLEQLDCFLGPVNHSVDVVRSGGLEEEISFFRGQALIDSARDGSGAMDLLAGRGLYYFLPKFPQEDALDRNFPVSFHHPDYIPDGGVSIKTE